MARKLPRFLTPVEIAAMFRAAEGQKRDLMLLKCMYFLGLRNSEVQTLKLDDIDLLNRNVKVVQSKRKKDRYVPIQAGFVDEMKVWIGDRQEGYLIPGRRNRPLSDRHIRRIVKQYARLANVRKYDEIHPHTLRHSYATHLQNRGVPLNAIQKLLGHENVETTTIYLHLGTERMKEWVDRAFESPDSKKPGQETLKKFSQEA